MTALFLSSGYFPHPTGRGSSVLTYGLISCFRNIGFKVVVAPVSLLYTSSEDEEFDKNFLTSNDITIVELPEFKIHKKHKNIFNFFRRIIFPRETDFFNSNYAESESLLSLIKNKHIQIVISYGWQALPLALRLKNTYLIASLVDPIWAVNKLRWKMLKQHSLKRKLFELMSLVSSRDIKKYCYKYLRKYDLILEHAYHHTVELKNDGFKNVHYLPHPLPVPKLENLTGIKKPVSFDSGLVTVLIAGSLKGASSRVGFQFFLSEIVPGLLNRNSEIIFPYKFRIVGHGKMLPSLKKRVEEVENLKFIGFVKNIEEEYKRADIMLVTIPVKHGFRTRIAEAFSYGMCVVAHGANCEGMPEIKDGYNALTANEPEILTSKLIEAINNPDLRIKLRRNARKTFINNLSIDVATKKLSKMLEEFLSVTKKSTLN